MTGWDWAALVIPLSYGVIVAVRCGRAAKGRNAYPVTPQRAKFRARAKTPPARSGT